MSQKFEIKEILKFLVGGGSAVITDAVMYILLRRLTDISTAKAISYISGAAVGFVINKLWTFESKRFKFSEVWKYIGLYMCSAAANTYTNNMVLYFFSSSVFAFLCATGISTIMNFLGQKFIVFKKEA